MRTRSKYSAAVYIFLFVTVFVVYAPILRDPLIRDDYWLLGQVRDIDILHLWRLAFVQIIYFRPLGELVYWLQWRFFGIEALPSHVLSLGSQALDACLLFWFLGLLRIKRLTAFFAALLFALAPIGVEAVTWSAVRFDLNALGLMLLSLGLYFIFLRRRRSAAYAASLAAAFAAVMVKEPAAILMALIPLLEIIYHRDPRVDAAPYRQRGFWRTVSIRWLPLGGLFLFYMILRLAVLRGLGGATSVLGTPSAHAVDMSLISFILPYSWLVTGTNNYWWSIIPAIALLLAVAGMILVLKRPCRHEARRAALFFAAFFLLALGPVFAFVFIIGIPQNLANSRYLFIPAMAFITLAVIIVFDISRRRRGLVFVALALLAGVSLFDVWAIQKNNRPWQAADTVSGSILTQTRALVPDPAPGSVFYFKAMPVMSGYRVFEHITFQPAVAIVYQRDDIKVYVEGDSFDRSLLHGAYVFSYDQSRGKLSVAAPGASAGPA